MLYKFGGIYLDLDFVTLNSLTHYQNMVVSEPLSYKPHNIVCGGALAFRKNNKQRRSSLLTAV